MEYLAENAINIFTDGSSKEGPRRGGVGFRIVTVDDDGHEVTLDESPNGYPGATNNEMELQACILAIRLVTGRRSPVDIDRFDKIVIYTDSKYIHKHLPTAIHRWSSSGWMRGSGPPVLNATLWKELLALQRRSPLPVYVEWIPGKSSAHAKAVDKLAKDSAERPYSRPISTPTVRRKLSERSVEPGSVPMEGQVVEVRIIQGQYLSLQRCHRYKYEVVSGDLEGAVDQAVSTLPLRGAHTYRVRFNDDQDNPRIEEEFGEVPSD